MFEIELTVNSLLEEPASQILSEAGAEGCAIYAKSDPLSEDEIWDGLDYDLPEGMCKVVGYVKCHDTDKIINDIKNRISEFKTFGIDFGTYALEVREIMDINWAEEHKKYYQTVFIDDIAVVPVWDKESLKNIKDKKLIILEPGAAFGTGLHETTKMCMKLLRSYTQKGDIVYDIGCGSGILSILASVLGAKKVTAADIDEIAVSAAQKNAALNKINNITVKKGDMTSVCEDKADIIAANIIASILKDIIPNSKKYLKSNGILILSGILTHQSDDIKQVLNNNKFAIINELAEGDWVSISAKNEE